MPFFGNAEAGIVFFVDKVQVREEYSLDDTREPKEVVLWVPEYRGVRLAALG